MLEVAPNPYFEPIKKFVQDLKETKWKFPYLLQIIHGLLTISLLFLLSVLYLTIGLISQISNSFWDIIVGLGQRMSFANPIPSLFYAISATIYFIFFLPFFLIQSPIWLAGWLTSKIGFRPFLILLITIIVSVGLYYFQPKFASDALEKVIAFQDSIRSEYFASDSLKQEKMKISNINKMNVIK